MELKEIFEKAKTLHENKNYKVVISLLIPLIEKENKNCQEYPLMLYMIGNSYLQLGRSFMAINYLEKFIAISDNREKSDIWYKAKRKLAACYINCGLFDKAINCLKVALNYYYLKNEKKGIGICLSHFGLLHYKLGNYETAEFYLTESLKHLIIKKQERNELIIELLSRDKVINIYELLSLIKIIKKDYKTAEKYLKYAFEISNISPPQNKPSLYITLSTLYATINNFVAAINNCQKALTYLNKKNNINDWCEANRLLGEYYYKTGNLQKSILHLNEALDICSNTKIIVKNDIHRWIACKKDLSLTLKTFYTSYPNTNDEVEFFNYLSKAVEYESKRNNLKAYENYKKSIELFFENHNEKTLEEEIREKIDSTLFHSILNEIVPFLPKDTIEVCLRLAEEQEDEGYYEEAFIIAEKGKARTLLNNINKNINKEDLERNIKKRTKQLKEEVEGLKAELQELKNSIDALMEKRERLSSNFLLKILLFPYLLYLRYTENKLTRLFKQKDRKRRNLETRIKDIKQREERLFRLEIPGVEKLKEELRGYASGKKMMLLEYFFLRGDRYVVFYLPLWKEGERIKAREVRLDIGAFEMIKEAIGEYHELLENNAIEEALERLDAINRVTYDNFIRPVEDILNGESPDALLVVPTEFMYELPFSSAYDEERKRYLIEDYGVCYLISSSMATVLQRDLGFNGKALLMANPKGNLESAVNEVTEVEKTIEKLKSKLKNRVKRLKVEKYLYGAAMRSVFRELAKEQGIIHMTTHMKFNRECPLDSYIVFSDGSLKLRELIEKVPMEQTMMCVLSGCESGRAKVQNGDEVLGLQTGVLCGGALSVISALWKIDDQATAEIMRRFYTNLIEGKDKIEALREAQREYKEFQEKMQEKYHPFYWASFVLYADYSSIISQHL